MKKFLILIAVFLFTGCAAQPYKLAWRVKDVVLEREATVDLVKPDRQSALILPTRTLQELMLAHLRINRSAGVQSELYIVDGDEPNAFAGAINNGQRIIAINLGMVKLVGNDVNEYAALIGHEAAHWAKSHVEAGQVRTKTLNALGTLVGSGLGMAGVPAAGIITGFGVDLVDSAYNRDQEREADAQSIEYMRANNYNPVAAITLQEKFLKIEHGRRLPFLSSHPSGAERIQNLKLLIQSKTSEP